MPNRLAGETSPYLLQHQHNPVNWWPWSREAFAEAQQRDVPVFLSVGYSTCYWCHVMERQVFENEALAAQMNAGFVNIKVDREERPDVDEHYMTATQVLTGQGGWPMSVFLTPRGEPFFAGTYFPPEDHHGRPGFARVLEAIGEAWGQRRNEISQTVETLRDVLRRLGEPSAPTEGVILDEDLLVRLVERSAADYDPRFGGFGGAPKFPRQTLLEMLLVARQILAAEAAKPRTVEGRVALVEGRLRHTLDAMANGGIRDHLGGGFHRYSTDAKWLVPHFEIMLYDQALLAWCYAEAARQFQELRYGHVARGICDFVLREMTHTAGAFYTAFDAEVNALEGASYLWTPAEVEAVLGPEDAAVFNGVYGLDRGFNFADPHGPNPHTPDRNVLFLAQPEREDDPLIAELRKKLKAARDERKQPLLDTKIITSWNGLMIRALAHAGDVLEEPRYIEAAQGAAEWILREHRNEGGGLIRSSREGRKQSISGFLDDYAFLGRGLMALHDATGEPRWRRRASELADYIQSHFSDAPRGGYFFSDTSRDELGAMTGIRRKVSADSPLPSGNASAAMLMLELDRPDPCRRALEVFAGQLVELTGSASAMLEAAIHYVAAHGRFTVSAGAAVPAQNAAAAEAEAAVEVIGAQWLAPERLQITLRIAEPFHLYAEGAEVAQAVSISSPHPAFARMQAPAALGGQYRGEVSFTLIFSRPAATEELELTLQYQVCDESRCLMPVSRQIRIEPAG